MSYFINDKGSNCIHYTENFHWDHSRNAGTVYHECLYSQHLAQCLAQKKSTAWTQGSNYKIKSPQGNFTRSPWDVQECFTNKRRKMGVTHLLWIHLSCRFFHVALSNLTSCIHSTFHAWSLPPPLIHRILSASRIPHSGKGPGDTHYLLHSFVGFSTSPQALKIGVPLSLFLSSHTYTHS